MTTSDLQDDSTGTSTTPTPLEAVAVTNIKESPSLSDKIAANEDIEDQFFEDTPALVSPLAASSCFRWFIFLPR